MSDELEHTIEAAIDPGERIFRAVLAATRRDEIEWKPSRHGPILNGWWNANHFGIDLFLDGGRLHVDDDVALAGAGEIQALGSAALRKAVIESNERRRLKRLAVVADLLGPDQ